jgi:hypothetical protein
MILASFGESLPSTTVSTPIPRATFWRDPTSFNVKPPRNYPVPTSSSDGRTVPGSSSGATRPTKHLSGLGSIESTVGVGVLLSGLVGGFLLWRKWKSSSGQLGSSSVLRPSNPRIKFHDNGRRVTVSGMNYQDLRSILDLASIEAHRSLEADRGKDKEGEQYFRERIKLLQYMHNQIGSEINRVNRQGRPVLPPIRKQRWANVREERHERLLLDKILDEMQTTRKSKKKKKNV